MKWFVICLVLAGLAGISSYRWTYRHLSKRAPADDTVWLRDEFALTDGQVRRIKTLRAEYRPAFEAHCVEFRTAYANLVHTMDLAHGWTPEVTKAWQRFSEIQNECDEATLHHAVLVSQSMPADQGQRYMDMVRTRLFLHGGAPLQAATH